MNVPDKYFWRTRLFYALVRLAKYPINFILFLWVRRLPAHEDAVREYGVRVVTPDQDGVGLNNQDVVYHALEILEKYAPEYFNEVKKQIRFIFLLPYGSSRLYFRLGRICVFNPSHHSLCVTTSSIAVASYLVKVTWEARLVWDERNKPLSKTLPAEEQILVWRLLLREIEKDLDQNP